MRRLLIPVVLVLAALSLAGCSSFGQSTASLSDVGTPEGQVASPASGGKDSAGSPSVDREIVTTGSVTIKAGNPIKAADAATELVEGAGGRIDARTQTAATKTTSGHATLQLRIPAAALTDTLAALKKLGTVESVKIAAQDVTTQGQDMDAQIHALSTSVTRLLALEAKATDTKTLIELETAISDRQGQLDSLTSQRRYLSDQVAMSSISLNLVSPADVPATTPANAGDALSAGLAAFGGFFVGLFILLSYLLPWLLLAAAVAVVVVYGLRRRSRRARVQVQETPVA
ncbi:MAG: hypothetical protein QOF79_2934 [Actinomycetota bacterium]|nr:hypothetical protein [Actinomycetota bacterium]